MLVLTRRVNERILFPTLDVSIQVVAVQSGLVRLGIQAPGQIPVFREEVLRRSEAARIKPFASDDRKEKPRQALVVDDDQNECSLLAGFLRLAGLEVMTAGDGADALDYLRTRGRPDILLLDMLMPRCDGVSTVRAIRRDPNCAGLKIYALTGHSPEHLGVDPGDTGIDRWFRKPVDPEVLLRDLKQELGGLG